MISTIKIKNAFKFTKGGGGGRGGGGDDQLKLGGVVAHSIELNCQGLNFGGVRFTSKAAALKVKGF